MDMRQNRGFLHTVRLPSTQETRQSPDRLCVKRKDKNSDKSQHDIMLTGTHVACDATQRESRVQEKAEKVQKNNLIAEPREPVQLPHGATKSDSILDSFTGEAR